MDFSILKRREEPLRLPPGAAGALALAALAVALGAASAFGADAADPLDGVLWWGRGAVALHHERTVYLDPYGIREAPRDADLILITHPHYDHCSRADVLRVAKAATRILTVRDCADKLDLGDRVVIVEPGRHYEEAGVAVETVAAYDPDGVAHPRDRGWVGFVVRSAGRRYYHAGDTALVPEMGAVRADVAFVPVGGDGTMNAYEASEAAERVGAAIAVPIHWGTGTEGRARVVTFKQRLGDRARLLPRRR